MAVIMATGKIWLRVPESMKIEVDGKFPAGVIAKDLILKIIGDVGADGALYRAVEFCGPAIEEMPLSGRFTLCNMAVEMGAKNGYVQPDAVTLAFLNGRARGNFDIVKSDPDATFIQTLKYDVTDLEPQVACPHTVDNVSKVAGVAGTPVHQVVIGSCTNGRLDDLQAAASVLQGKKVAAGTRLLILPASREILREATADGTVATLLDAGAVLLNPNCGPCMGNHQGALAPGETALSSSNRNFKGRMGCKDAEIYLGSPLTCAASAMTGKITDVREVASAEEISQALAAQRQPAGGGMY
jgi:homoaconitase/3-isopropylmalate dehydratase large subunit